MTKINNFLKVRDKMSQLKNRKLKLIFFKKRTKCLNKNKKTKEFRKIRRQKLHFSQMNFTFLREEKEMD